MDKIDYGFCSFANAINKAEAQVPNTKNLSFVVSAQPEGKPRPRVTRRGTYTPVTDFSLAVQRAAMYVMEIETKIKNKADIFHAEAYEINIVAVFKRPKSHYRQGKSTSHLLTARAPMLMTHTPDKDNIEKAVLDAITKAGLIHEDAAVIDGRTQKHWATNRDDEGYCMIEIIKISSEGEDI